MKAIIIAFSLVACAFAYIAHIDSESTAHAVNFQASEFDEHSNMTVAQVSFSCNTAGYPRARAGVGAVAGNSTSTFKYEYRVGLLELKEAVCADDDKGFVPSTDLSEARNNTIPFRSDDGSSWSPIVVSGEGVEGSNYTVKVAETHYPNSNDWKISITMKLAEKEAACSSQPYLGPPCSPSALRVIVLVRGLTYTLGAASRQVLKFAVDSSETPTLTSDNRTHTGMLSFGSVLAFKWSTNATADSQESSLVVSPLVADDGAVYAGDDDRKDTETRKLIYFTLPSGHPDSVEWEYDVAIDVARFVSPAPRRAVLGTGAAALAALAALLAL